MNESAERLWGNYLKSINETLENTNLIHNVWSFGDTPYIADNLVHLVLTGEKSATTSLHYLYEVENEPLPKIGDIGIITDYNGSAMCIIKTTSVTVLPFCNVNEEFAYKEGEGDKSLNYWREEHINFFNNSLQNTNITFSEDMLVVCEEFQVIYK